MDNINNPHCDRQSECGNIELCESCVYHTDVIEHAKGNMPDDEVLYDLAEIFRVFGDTTRIKILWLLFSDEMCVCDMAELLNMNQSAISHQLRLLRNARLVRSRRDGKQVFYSLDDEHVREIFDKGLAHIQERR
ncbi:MAG: helix-turn-helix transcriptional regulator [Clostridia bacterium]|nr:helix-turn-helix transcriptional regulator [Clostridia bacterium]